MTSSHRESGLVTAVSFDCTIERMTDAFVALDHNWRYRYVNQKAAMLFNRRQEDLVGKYIWKEFPEGVGQPFYRAYQKAATHRVCISIEDYYPPWDRWFENRIYPSKDGLSIYFQDVTDRKRQERYLKRLTHQFQRALRASTVGRLAADLVQDFSCLLPAILGRAEESLDSGKHNGLSPSDELLITALEKLRAQGQQADCLLHRFLGLGDDQTAQAQALDLNAIIHRMEKVMQELLGQRVTLCTCLSNDLGRVRIAAQQIEQVILTLIVDAKDAMPNGGRLTIQTSNIAPQEPQAARSTGPQVLLGITDTGQWINRRAMNRISRPLFGQPQGGRVAGGLGMGIVHKIINQAKGRVAVENCPGQATTVRLYFPVAQES